jgi:hypothetical protein
MKEFIEHQGLKAWYRRLIVLEALSFAAFEITEQAINRGGKICQSQ